MRVYLLPVMFVFCCFILAFLNKSARPKSENESITDECLNLCGDVDKIVFEKTHWDKNKKQYKCACIVYKK